MGTLHPGSRCRASAQYPQPPQRRPRISLPRGEGGCGEWRPARTLTGRPGVATLCAMRERVRGSGRHDLEDVPVRVVEIDAAAAAAMVDLAVGARARPAAVGDAFCPDPAENRVEFGLADPEGE